MNKSLTLICFGQTNYGLENYNWNKLVKVMLLNDVDVNFETDALLIDSLGKTEQTAACENIAKFKMAFATLPYGLNKDIILEKAYILLCEFKDGQKVPFKYFPNQYAIFDMRKEFQYYYSFPEKNNRMREVIGNCINSLDSK